ncbi:hypothetical protein [uncultured Enterovirga sp.]
MSSDADEVPVTDDPLEICRASYKNAWVALRMIRDAVETLGPPPAR